MGGKGGGPRPDVVRQRRAASLYARGISVAQVAARMRCTRQAVYHLLRDAGLRGLGLTVRCAGCSALLAWVGTMGKEVEVYCAACLAGQAGGLWLHLAQTILEHELFCGGPEERPVFVRLVSAL